MGPAFAGSTHSDQKSSHLKYVKIGEATNFLHSRPEVGIGYRFHRRIHGCDLSVNYASIGRGSHHSSYSYRETWISGKALYLLYPIPKAQGLYFGTGLGVVHGIFNKKWIKYDYKFHNLSIFDIWMGLPIFYIERIPKQMKIHKRKIYPTFETSLGVEFCVYKNVKVFTQFELSIPLQRKSSILVLNQKEPGETWKAAITCGVGF